MQWLCIRIYYDFSYARKSVKLMKNKKVYIIILICLVLVLKFLSISKDDNKAMEEHVNSVYEDYKANPQNYVLAQGKIIREYDADDGFEISFYGAREWIVEVKIPDGSVVEAQVVRDQEHNIGDTIDIAYENADTETLVKYMNATQLSHVECFAANKSIKLLEKITIIAMVGIVVFAIFKFVKK